MIPITICIPTLFRDSLLKAIESIHRQGIEVNIMTRCGCNPARQRNEMTMQVDTPYIMYMDDDCVLQSGAIAILQDVLERDTLDMVFPKLKGTMNTSPLHIGAGGCILVRTQVAVSVMWDEELSIGEDLDFTWRAMDIGYTYGFCSNAVVYHLNKVRSHNTWGKKNSAFLLSAKHPKRYKWLTKHQSTVLGVK